MTTANEVLTTSMGGRTIATFEVRLAADDASLVGRWGARYLPYEPPLEKVMGKKSARTAFGETDADADDEEGEVQEDAGEGAARAKREKPAPSADPGVGGGGGAAAPAGPKAGKRPLVRNKNERDARRERVIRIVIAYPKSPWVRPDPGPAAESKGK